MTEPERITVGGGGVALSFPVNDDETTTLTSSSSSREEPPLRLRNRLLVEPKTPLSIEEIEVKLREANLRRQRYYEVLSSKARSKARSGLRDCSTREKDLGQKLEARLNAAQQKRLSMIAEAQMRLARLDELRQAAKIGVETRFEKERDELGMKVKSRAQQAEANRMLLLKAFRQQRTAKRERAAQLLTKKMAQESKYKDTVHAAIYRKRAAAERKRMGLLEAERTKARTMVLQVKQVARSIYSQRETERKRMKGQWEYQLQKPTKQRAEYLTQRRRLNSQPHVNSKLIDAQGAYLSRKLARCWRRFVKLRKTTLSLAKAFESLQISEDSVKSIPFDQLALHVESATTMQTTKTFLDRLEIRFTLSWAATCGVSTLLNVDHLLKRVALPNHRAQSSLATRGGAKAIKTGKLSRYPVRVVLCAYMIIGHPDAVFNGEDECNSSLTVSAANFIQEFELLIKIIIDGPAQSSLEEIASGIPSQKTFRSQLEAFDKAWCSYLHHFVQWKFKDAKLLEGNLVKAACDLELSRLQTCKLTSVVGHTHDMNSIQKQVSEDQKFLREMVQHLSGMAGLEHMERALSNMRSKCNEAKGSGSSLASSTTDVSSSCSPGSLVAQPSVSSFGETEYLTKGGESSRQFVRSVFDTDGFPPHKELSPLPSKSITDDHLNSDNVLISENELLVNEIVHQHSFSDSLNITDENQNSLQARVRETMEKAFWDGIMESIKLEEPNFSWVLKLMKEVRDELCEISPRNWRQEIVEIIDVDILSQVLRSGILDMDYLGKILEFVLVTLQKLSAPARDEELKTSHNNLLKELEEMSQAGDKSNASFALLLIKGLRFVLKEIQILKREISRARIRLVEPLVKGPAGLEYLKNAFANRYGPPINAPSSLPLTRQWLVSLCPDAEHEWEEHMDSGSATTSNAQKHLPTALRTGGTISMTSKIGPPSSATGFEQPGCTGERLDVLVRLGLLKLVSGVGGLTLEVLPETLKLNLSRLSAVQSQLQKIMVISTSLLVLRQTILTENLVAYSTDMENILSECTKKISEVLDRVKDAGILEIVDTISELLKERSDLDAKKLQSSLDVISSMLVKSLQAGDAVCALVSRSIYLSMRGAVFGGSGSKGRQLVETVLRRVGAAALANRVIETAEVLILVAMVTCRVHWEWYEELIKNL